MNFGEILINALAPALQEAATKHLATTLRKIQPAEKRRDTLMSLYVPIDTALENYTDASKTKIDDAIVDALKMAVEIVAAEDNVTLPNADGD